MRFTLGMRLKSLVFALAVVSVFSACNDGEEIIFVPAAGSGGSGGSAGTGGTGGSGGSDAGEGGSSAGEGGSSAGEGGSTT